MFPLIEVRGTPYEMGLQHGEACSHLIRRYVDVLLDQMSSGPVTMAAQQGDDGFVGDRRLLLEHVRAFLPWFEDYSPRVLEEIRGVAAGAGVSLEEALLCNVRGEILRASEGCTAFVLSRNATASGEILIGQTMDSFAPLQELCIVLSTMPDQGPPILMYSHAGCVGYMGLNGNGAANCANSLNTGARRMGVPHYPMKRLLLETTSVEEGIELMRRTPVTSSGNYVMCDGSGAIADVELTPEGMNVLRNDRFLVHTNHFLEGPFMNNDLGLTDFPDTVNRFDRALDLVSSGYGNHTLETMQQLLRDHENSPHSICRHESKEPLDLGAQTMKTIAAYVAEPERGLLHVSPGNPCENAFLTYALR